jgi:hypothetical protein
MYGETNLGATDEAVITYFKTPMNKPILDALKRHVYPEFAAHFGTSTTTPAPTYSEPTLTEPVLTEPVAEPPANPTSNKKSSK